jgi:acyl carrier protein
MSVTMERIRDAWLKVLEIERVDLDDDFFAIGGNSLGAVELAIKLGGLAGRSLPDEFVFDYRTVRAQFEALPSVAVGPSL